MSNAQREIESGKRFAFGENWRQFLNIVNEDRITAAERSLQDKLGSITGLRLIDIGAGSGLLSLAARNLGASVVSVDYDPACVDCTNELRRRYRPNDPSWTILEGSALDSDFLSKVGSFDIVYSWGVLHHTGDMWEAMSNMIGLVAIGGRLFISIYNDQGAASRQWKRIKRTYNNGSPLTRSLIVTLTSGYFQFRHAVGRMLELVRNGKLETIDRGRGMDRRRDLIDWVGGYPFEVAKPEEIFAFYHDKGFRLDRLKTCAGSIGCNEFIFTREM